MFSAVCHHQGDDDGKQPKTFIFNILIFNLLALYIESSAFYHPHFSIRILSSAFYYPPSAIRHPPSAIHVTIQRHLR